MSSDAGLDPARLPNSTCCLREPDDDPLTIPMSFSTGEPNVARTSSPSVLYCDDTVALPAGKLFRTLISGAIIAVFTGELPITITRTTNGCQCRLKSERGQSLLTAGLHHRGC